MQLNPALYPSIMSTGSTIARQEGVRALWKASSCGWWVIGWID